MGRQLTSLAGSGVPAILATAALILSLAPELRWPWFLATCAAVLALGATARPGPPLGAGIAPQALLAAGVVGQWAHPAGLTWPVAVGGLVLAGTVLTEPLLQRAARPEYLVRNLPVAASRLARTVDNGVAWWAGAGALVVAGGLAAAGAPGWALPVIAGATAGLAAWLLVDAWRRRRAGHRRERAALRAAVTDLSPAFLLYFSAPPGSDYQVTMWLPYLDRIGAPYLVVLAEPGNLPAITRATRAPVVAHRTFGALDAVVVPRVRAAFYVNNGMRNLHCIRYPHLTHVQLYHGYSDKPVSVNPVAAVYDRMFVPGQAIVDQFAASPVAIPADRFRIVGRPQAEALSVAARPAGPADPGGRAGRPVVLYAPTWAGEYADSNYCSLAIGPAIVAALLERGATVILRPHPYAGRHPGSARQVRRLARTLARDRAATGRPHRWGRAAEADLDLAGCMNLSHALLCDVSSVASTYLYTGKPYAVTDMVTADGSFAGGLPLATGGYVLRRDAGNLGEVLDALLGGDPAAPARAELRAYYLGDFPTDRYAEAFLTAARSAIGDGPDLPAGDSGSPVDTSGRRQSRGRPQGRVC